jgi:hypothetical protein
VKAKRETAKKVKEKNNTNTTCIDVRKAKLFYDFRQENQKAFDHTQKGQFQE